MFTFLSVCKILTFSLWIKVFNTCCEREQLHSRMCVFHMFCCQGSMLMSVDSRRNAVGAGRSHAVNQLGFIH